MNNYILINRTFAEATPESSENGEFSNTGFISEGEQVTFRELVKLMKEHIHPSQSPHDGNIHVWFSTSSYTSDYSKGISREESIHFHHENTANAGKYWKLASKIAHGK